MVVCPWASFKISIITCGIHAEVHKQLILFAFTLYYSILTRERSERVNGVNIRARLAN